MKKYFRWLYRPLKKIYRDVKTHNYIKAETDRLGNLLNPSNGDVVRVFYLGITEHSNLGDMAQHFCIKNWIAENYPDAELVMFEATTVVDRRFGFIDLFKKVYRDIDIIVFQSGYTTSDLGGCHDEMHRLICSEIPKAHILMMPQTIYFQSEKNKERTAKLCGKAHNMLFLARDAVSYKTAKSMFANVNVVAYPDIVTTLIGKFQFDNNRKGICLCRRNDGEKYYSEEELQDLEKKLGKFETVTVTDTTINASYLQIRANLRNFIESEIEKLSHFKVVITDRYHGTIFSLAAGTPVIIIKTTDHKVVTGADWFHGIYDRYVYVAHDLDDAYNKVLEILSGFEYETLRPVMKKDYYDKLKELFTEISFVS